MKTKDAVLLTRRPSGSHRNRSVRGKSTIGNSRYLGRGAAISFA